HALIPARLEHVLDAANVDVYSHPRIRRHRRAEESGDEKDTIRLVEGIVEFVEAQRISPQKAAARIGKKKIDRLCRPEREIVQKDDLSGAAGKKLLAYVRAEQTRSPDDNIFAFGNRWHLTLLSCSAPAIACSESASWSPTWRVVLRRGPSSNLRD